VRKAVASGRLKKSIGYAWKCQCGHRWIAAVGLGPNDPGRDAVHDCEYVRELIEQLAHEQARAKRRRR
jgi:hypothetical protein